MDSLKIVWHGHYIKYFEDAREAFGQQFGLGYLSVYEKGFSIPIVKIHCDYKRPLSYGDQALIRCTFADTKAAKIIFDYEIFHSETAELVATGQSTQVFLDHSGALQLIPPVFFLEWKEAMGLKK